MTSQERHEARYQRRKAAREQKRIARARDALDYDKVFSFIHLYRSAQKCYRGVSWKASVQSYKSRGGINVSRKYREMKSGSIKLHQYPEFYIWERGHKRRINSIHIEDRVPQKCNSAYSLKPVLHRSLVYDNYASQEGKGTTQARKRVKCMLERHIRRYGMTGGVIIYDFKGFFDSIQHALVRQVLDRSYTTDRRITDFNMKVIHKPRDNVGLVLGSENSQDFAISTPGAIDHYIREVLRVDSSGRYMDDGIIVHHDFDYLKTVVYPKLAEIAQKYGFRLNDAKTQIIRFGTPFVYLKRKYSFTDTGGIIVRPVQKSVVRERRKIKKLYGRWRKGTLPFETGLDSLASWEASLAGCKCHGIIKSIENLYIRLYINDWICQREEERICIIRSYQQASSLTPAMS